MLNVYMDSKRNWTNLGEKNQMKAVKYKGTTSALGILCAVGGCKSTLEKYHSVFGFLFWRNPLAANAGERIQGRMV